MADKSLRSRLQRLFSTNVIVRNVGGKKLKVADTSRTQAVTRSNLVDRYQKIFTGAGLSGYSDSLLTKSMRLNLFKDYETKEPKVPWAHFARRVRSIKECKAYTNTLKFPARFAHRKVRKHNVL